MTLTKAQLTDSIRKGAGLPRKESAKAIESLLEIVKETFQSGEDLLVRGFGKFCVKDKKDRRGRNPVTGNDLALGARRVVIFKCSRVLRDKINGDR